MAASTNSQNSLLPWSSQQRQQWPQLEKDLRPFQQLQQLDGPLAPQQQPLPLQRQQRQQSQQSQQEVLPQWASPCNPMLDCQGQSNRMDAYSTMSSPLIPNVTSYPTAGKSSSTTSPSAVHDFGYHLEMYNSNGNGTNASHSPKAENNHYYYNSSNNSSSNYNNHSGFISMNDEAARSETYHQGCDEAVRQLPLAPATKQFQESEDGEAQLPGCRFWPGPETEAGNSQPPLSSWRFVWCLEECFKTQWHSTRVQFAETVRSKGGRLICAKSPQRLEQWLNMRGQLFYAVMVDWMECKPFLRIVCEAEAHRRPKFVIIRCPRASATRGSSLRARAQAWLQKNPLPAGMRYFLCSAFDAEDANISSIMDKVARVAFAHAEQVQNSLLMTNATANGDADDSNGGNILNLEAVANSLARPLPLLPAPALNPFDDFQGDSKSNAETQEGGSYDQFGSDPSLPDEGPCQGFEATAYLPVQQNLKFKNSAARSAPGVPPLGPPGWFNPDRPVEQKSFGSGTSDTTMLPWSSHFSHATDSPPSHSPYEDLSYQTEKGSRSSGSDVQRVPDAPQHFTFSF